MIPDCIFEMLARKAVRQSFSPSAHILALMCSFKDMTNECIRIGLASDTSTLKRLSLLSYHILARFRVPSYYKLGAISKAAGILASRTKSMRRGRPTKSPYLRKLVLTTCYGFKVTHGTLSVPIGNHQHEEVLLNRHVLKIISDPTLKASSFTLTETSL